ncbi:MAG TPA: alcohol dehydrogenase [Pelotomaculum sp.]|nr:alcohol dehydrogenase [Pelotomaculum sp.]
MKAAVLYELNKPLVVEEVDIEHPKDGEVLVKLAASGVCHSDLSAITGVLKKPLPVILGHEGAGVVAEVGPGVKNVKVGDHVVISWIASCGQCAYCIEGKPRLCPSAAKVRAEGTLPDGTKRLSINGQTISHSGGVSSFAEYCVVAESSAIPIRKDAPLDKAALVGCAVLTGVGTALNGAKVQPGSTVAVIGAGGVGLNVIQGSQLAGAEKIIAVDLADSKLEMAKFFGATHTVNSGKVDPVQAIKGLTGGLGVDYVIEVIGLPQTVGLAFDSIKKGGSVTLIGMPDASVTWNMPILEMIRKEAIVQGSYYGNAVERVDIPKYMDLYMAGKLKLDELISKFYTLDEINTVFKDMEKGEIARGMIIL